nr:hypothetical protein [Tanacetum cinerariifolium]
RSLDSEGRLRLRVSASTRFPQTEMTSGRHESAVIPLLDALSDEARCIGAVNTVVFRDGQRIGHNTDCSGFAEGFRRGLGDVERGCVVQMGAGGAGAAVAHALLSEGVGQLRIFDVESERAQSLVDNLNA